MLLAPFVLLAMISWISEETPISQVVRMDALISTSLTMLV